MKESVSRSMVGLLNMITSKSQEFQNAIDGFISELLSRILTITKYNDLGLNQSLSANADMTLDS